MKKTLKSITAIFLAAIMSLCCVVLRAESVNMKHEQLQTNYDRVCAVIEAGALYDLELYPDVESSVALISLNSTEFARLCREEATIFSLNTLIHNEKDVYLEYLMTLWYNYLSEKRGTSQINAMNETGYTSYSVTLPGGKILTAKIYTGGLPNSPYGNISAYPNAVQIQSYSREYNCHSYAWYLRGNITSHNPKLWFDTPNQFKNNSYAPVCGTTISASNLQAGDIVYYNTPDIGTHSAIVVSVSGGNIIVKSKWGPHEAYRHPLTECPYYTSGYTTLSYYRMVHQYVVYNGYYYCKCCGYKQ